MSEGVERQVEKLQYKAELRALVADAMQDAIQKVALKHNMGKENADAAFQAVSKALEGDVTSRSSEALRRVAEDAAEASFAQFGFTDAAVMGDLYVALDDELKARLQPEDIR